MPSPLPWDRKEAFGKDRKQDRGAGCDAVGGAGGVGGGSCSTSRWREPSHGPRDFFRASPRRPLTGHYRHDGEYQQLYSEESIGHGCTPSRSGDRFWPEEENFRARCGSRSTGSGGRDIRGSSRRSPSLDTCGDYTRHQHGPPVTAQRSVAVPITHPSPSSSSPIPSKNLLDKSDGGVNDGVGTVQKCDRDHSMGVNPWNPFKWSRPSSLPLSKTVRSDAEVANQEISVPQVKESPARSPVTSHLMLDDRAPSKKPRLGWGQGLAKYEKQKVEGSVDVSGQNGSAQSTSSAKFVVSDSSPKIPVLPGSMSPATPTSVACSSSPAGTDEKFSLKGLNAEIDRAQCSDSFGLVPHNSSEDISIKLDQLDANSVSTLALLLNDLMQPEDACSGDSSFTRNSTVNKLLLLKKDISKELEKTESEIDSFENTLKSINCDGQKNIFQEKSVDASKSLLELSSDSFVMASSVVLERQEATHTHLLDHCNSSGTILSDDRQLICLDTKNPNSCSLQCDARLQMQSSVLLPDEICSNEQAYCLDDRTEKVDDSLVAFITASNMDAAKRASEEFDQTMPTGLSQFNISEFDFLKCKKNYIHVRGRLAMDKHVLKFKERVLALKFRALHHLWREDLNLLTMRKHRPKSSKRYEVNSRSSQTASQKHRSSIRSRFALPAGNLTLVPTSEILNFTSKLLLDSRMRLYRDNLKMPAQIIDENDRRHSRFNSSNGLIDNPPALEKERVNVNPWLQEEKEVFLKMLATYGKDFQKISSFLTHKTTADCVEFYYKNHKSESFADAKKQLKRRKQLQSRQSNTYLITSGSRFKRESNASSLDLLGAASIIAAESNFNKRSTLKQSGKSVYHDTRVSRRGNGSFEKASSEFSGSEREVAAADVLAGICGALSSDAMSSCVTSSVDPPEKMIQFTAMDCSLTPEVTHTINEEDTCSDESSDELESADWSDEEKLLFIRALNMHGKDFIKVAHFVGTRSRDQCKIFFSKARKCLALDVIQPGLTNGVMPLSDVNGGRSDTDDACAAEIDSAICSTQSCSKMETCSEGHTHASQQAHEDRSFEQCEIGGSAIPDEVEGKFGNKASNLDEDKLVIEGVDIEFGKDQGEICSSVHVGTELFVDMETNNENADEMLSTGKSAAKLQGECEFKLPTTAQNHKESKIENKSNVKIEESDGNSCNVPLELLCSLQKRPQAKIVQPESTVSSAIPSDEADKESSIAILKLQDGVERRRESVGRDLGQNLPKIPFPSQTDPPLDVNRAAQNHKEMKIDGNCSFVSGLNNDKCEHKLERNLIEVKLDIGRTTYTHCDRLAESEDQSQRGGDLKLFGQILTHQSSQRSSSSSQENSIMPPSPRQNANTTTNLPSCWKDAAIFAPITPRLARNGLIPHHAELPQRSYGFWDGNRVQTGLSSSPEPAIMLTHYQRPVTGIPFSIVKESVASCNADHQQPQAQVQSRSTEKFLETYPELPPKRNGFDLLSGFQQQGRMMHLGMNIIGRGGGGGIVVGGNGVSDPVAALQMHYSGRTKILNGDLESLMGDAGGR